MTQTNYAEFYKKGPYRGFDQTHRTVGASEARLFRVKDRPPGHYSEPPISSFTLQMCLRGAGGVEFDFGAGRFRTSARFGQWVIAPATQECTYSLSAPLDLQVLELPETIFDNGRGGICRDFGDLHGKVSDDPRIFSLAWALWFEGEPRGARGLWADQTLAALGDLLAKSRRPQKASQVAGRLASWQVKRARERLGCGLEVDISLSALAAECRLSRYHFARAFKTTVGVPPHRYLIQLRIEKAKELLEHTALPITEIAAKVGYDDPSYFGRLFAKEVGAPPSRYRRERQT